jgi:hypothetical protein
MMTVPQSLACAAIAFILAVPIIKAWGRIIVHHVGRDD